MKKAEIKEYKIKWNSRQYELKLADLKGEFHKILNAISSFSGFTGFMFQ
ncbi:MAG: hypothetical protein K9L78_02665 [Victivallales bacterium]|nr:hypothetical protein [Victivallales bacterium]MCF7888998.1 hypothetical protein [Victivallales bacterium]